MVEEYSKYLFISFLLIILIFLGNKFAYKFNLLDFPNERKKHEVPIPLIGGVYFYIVLCLSIAFFNYPQLINLIIIYSSIIVFMGFLDDFYDLQVPLRFIIMIFASYLLIDQGLNVQSLGYFFNSYNVYLGAFSFIFTIICVVGLINSFNFLDGADGILITQAIISFILLIIFVNLSGNGFQNVEFISTLLIILIIMLIFNLGLIKNNKFFLGDSGSMSIGFIISFILIYYSQIENLLLHNSLVIWVVALPLFDFFSTVFRRVNKNKNPFAPDRTHIQHILLSIFKNKYIVLTIIFFLSFFIGIIGFFIVFLLGPFIGILSFLILILVYIYFSLRLEKKITY